MIRITGREKYIWSYFPDCLLDKIQVGHTVISSFENMYETTEKIMMELATKLKTSKIIILSDHGYICSEAGFAFPVPDNKRKALRDVFGSNRYISMNQADASHLVQDGYIVDFSGYYLVKSRYIWPVPGKYSIYFHGGLSLMECFVPMIEVRK